MRLEISGKVVSKEAGKLRGQYIAEAQLEGGTRVKFDVIEDIMKVNEGDEIIFLIQDSKPSNEELEESDFCGHGYLVEDEERAGKTIFSVWGMLFIFNNKLGLKINEKYYICIKRGRVSA